MTDAEQADGVDIVERSRVLAEMASRATRRCLALLDPVIPAPPVEWIEAHVNMGLDSTSASAMMAKVKPYQREPILAQFSPTCREVTIMAPEQTGKSWCWRMPMLYKMVFIPGPRWIIYESDDKAEDINAEQLHPLMEGIPELARQLTLPGTRNKRRYKFRRTVVEFSGAGAAITSKPKRDGVADELDTWPLSRDGIEDNLRNFRKRFRTWWRRGEGCLVKVSSPLGEDSIIADEFDRSSGEHWYLRCDGCGAATIRSDNIRAMQWEADGEIVKPETIVLDCPACGHSHGEDRAGAMTAAGEYIAERPENKHHRGFHWGALAAPDAVRWIDIAQAQMDAGKTAGEGAQRYLDNSIRGVRFKPRRVSRESEDKIRARSTPKESWPDMANIFFSADTQDNGWYWIARGIDAAENTYLAGWGFARTPDELAHAWDAEYCGLLCEAGIIDQGGHRVREVAEFVAERPGLLMYKGNSRIGVDWRLAAEEPRLILANPYRYQAELLYLIYTAPRNMSAGLWFLPDGVDDDYVQQIAAMRPDNKKRHGDRYENWQAAGADHFFDCEKMYRVLLEWARLNITTWRVPVEWAARRQTERRKSAVELEMP